jgi:hypothetical protein
MTQSSLVGTWKLVSWELRDDQGQISYPFGRDAIGYLTYTDDGHMSVIITTSDRQPFAEDDMLRGTVVEKATAAETCVAYCGTYQIDGDIVRIQVEASMFPNWLGTTQERTIEREGERIAFSLPPSLWYGKRQTARLVWVPA